MKKIFTALLLLFFCQVSIAQEYKEFIELHREGYRQSFLTDPDAPLKKADMQHLHFFEPDESYRVNATIELIEDAKPFKMPTFDGTSKSFVRYATASAMLKGKKIRLTLYKSMDLASDPVLKNFLFIPFTDLTTGQTTYGGGRYIDSSVLEIENGKLQIDFNKAYSPYCAYSTGYRCPIPPQENDLDIEIKAGEMKYTGEMKTRVIKP